MRLGLFPDQKKTITNFFWRSTRLRITRQKLRIPSPIRIKNVPLYFFHAPPGILSYLPGAGLLQEGRILLASTVPDRDAPVQIRLRLVVFPSGHSLRRVRVPGRDVHGRGSG